MKCIFDTNLVDFIFYNFFHIDEFHSDGYNNTIIIQMHIVWSTYFIHVECGPMLSYVLGGLQIHDLFVHIFGMCLITHYKWVVVININILYILALLALCFIAKNTQCGLDCHYESITLRHGVVNNMPPLFCCNIMAISSSWALSPCVLTSCASNMPSYSLS